jgi:uncharacterized protein (TIGR03437 family)
MRRSLPALLVLAVRLYALPQPGQPWSVLNVSQAGPVGDYFKTVATPTGDVYQSWFGTPTIPITATYGDTSKASTFITRITAAGAPRFAAQIGGAYRIDALAVDTAGNAYFAGAASSAGLPVTPGAYRSTSAGDFTDYICGLSSSGSLVFCTYLDTNQFLIENMAVDRAGAIYLIGVNLGAPLPVTPGAFAQPGGVDLVTKFAPGASSLVFTAALNTGTIASIAVDNPGNIFVCGIAPAQNDPTIAGSTLWVLKSDGSALLYSALLRQSEQPISMALDSSANVYLVGTELDGSMSVRKYAGYGPALVYEQAVAVWPGPFPFGPFIRPLGLAVDDSGNASIAGYTSAVNFPTRDPVLSCNSAAMGSTEEGFLMRLSSTGDVLQSTWLPQGGEPLAISATASAIYLPAGALAPAGGAQFIIVTVGPQSGAAGLPFACVGNGAGFQLGALAPGEILSLFGSGIGPQQGATWQLDSNQRLTTTVAGVQVTFEGTPAPLLYVQSSQINAIAPWELAGHSASQVCVTYQSARTNCIAAAVTSAAPGVFSIGGGAAAAVNQDGTLNSSGNPAPGGSIVSIYATGLGPVVPTPVDGSATGFPLPALVSQAQVMSTQAKPPDTPAVVAYAGPAPLEPAGLSQINFQIPFGAAIYSGYVQVALPDGTKRRSPYFTIYRK